MQKPKHDFEPIAVLSMEGIASRAFLESVRMKLYDALETPQTAAQVAATFATAPPATEALLDLLAARSVLYKSGDTYANSPAAREYLVSTSPFYQGNCIELHQQPNDFVMQNITDFLRGTARPAENGPKSPPSPAALTGIAQFSLRGGLQDTVDFVAALPGFSQMRTVCDVGGSHGRYAMAILDLNPHLRAVIADLPDVAPAAAAICAEAGYADRLAFIACDLRSDSLPLNTYDLVLASHVFYAVADSLPQAVLKIAASLKPGGWLVSHHLDPNNESSRRFRTAIDFGTCLLSKIKHVLPPAKLETAIERAGLEILKTGTSGLHAENLLVAAQKPSAS